MVTANVFFAKFPFSSYFLFPYACTVGKRFKTSPFSWSNPLSGYNIVLVRVPNSMDNNNSPALASSNVNHDSPVSIGNNNYEEEEEDQQVSSSRSREQEQPFLQDASDETNRMVGKDLARGSKVPAS